MRKVSKIGYVVPFLAAAIFGCKDPVNPPVEDDPVVNISELEDILNDNQVDVYEGSDQLSADVSVDHGELDSIIWKQGSNSGNADYSNGTIYLETSPDYGDFDLLVKGKSPSGELEDSLKVEGLTYGPSGSRFVQGSYDFNSLDDGRDVGTGGFPSYFVENDMFNLSSDDVRIFAGKGVTKAGYDDTGSDDIIVFMYDGQAIGFGGSGIADNVRKDCPLDSRLVDYFIGYDGFTDRYTDWNAFTPGAGGFVGTEYTSGDLETMFNGLSFKDAVKSSAEFRYGESDATNNYVTACRNSDNTYPVFDISQAEYTTIDANDPYN